jgi:mannose/fructose/N-acetylgalactosamine-specific phosphotransferase system component IIC
MIAPLALALLLAWGTLTGMDLVSWPQLLLHRPIVAATVSGLLVGDVAAGLLIGVVLELFALDVLPIGAVRYPDYGPPAVAAAAGAAGLPATHAIALMVPAALLLALAGGRTHTFIRQANSRTIDAMSGELAAGSTNAIRRVQRTGLARDLIRSAALTALALGVTLAVRRIPIDPITARALAAALSGGALAAAAGGALRSAGHGSRMRWLAAGLGAGTLTAVLR